ncbi:MAG TPA: sensor histidine kinase [Mycobacteriales bacterium]|nr:sensor histidine kinase [Mycobacteriales bacterium]
MRRVLDVAIPAAVGIYQTALIIDPGQDHGSWLTLLGVVCAVGSGAVLIWRRPEPVRVMLATLVLGLVLQLLAPYAVFPVGALVAMWSLTVVRPPRLSLPGLAAVLGLTAVALLDSVLEDVWFAMAVAVAIWALGEAVRSRRQAILEASRRAVGEEQARIARELHDVIAHSVSVIVVQAAAADDVFDSRPDQARTALRSIEAAGREALGELRQLLGAVSAPRPGLGRLAELTAPLQEAGLEVAVHREGAAGLDLPAGVDLSAYRIVQEALTNTLRHARATRASVTIRTVGGDLELDVSDDGTAPSDAGSGPGRGLAGMRERAAMLGGTLDAGPMPDGGFRVRARLPLEAAR